MSSNRTGIPYFPFGTDTVSNRKIKLLYSEFSAQGCWVWFCLLCRIYEDNGYYFDTSDHDELILFSSDVCKMPVSEVEDIIDGCVRRGLFDKAIFEEFRVLTSDEIQTKYIRATRERRKKGATVFLRKDFLLVSVPDSEPNLWVESEKKFPFEKAEEVPGKMDEVPGKTDLGQENNSSKVPETKTDIEGVQPEAASKSEKVFSRTRAPTPEEVLAFFEEWGSSPYEGGKFYDHYHGNGWLQAGKTPILDWESAARNWIRRIGDFKQKKY